MTGTQSSSATSLGTFSGQSLPRTPALFPSIQRDHSYPLHPEPISKSSDPAPGASKRGSLTAHENPSNGTLVLGHASLLTTFLLTPDEQYIVTADRDEHIRVSWFPRGYNVERYCLGHEKCDSPSFLLSHPRLDIVDSCLRCTSLRSKNRL